MKEYLLTITLADCIIHRTATGDRDALMDAAYDEFGACGIFVRPI